LRQCIVYSLIIMAKKLARYDAYAVDIDNKVFNNIRMPVGYRWARAIRNRIKNKLHKTIFDVESDPRYRRKSIEVKTKIINETNKKFKPNDYVELFTSEVEEVISELHRNRSTLSAMTYMFMSLWTDQKIFDHLDIAMEKAIKLDDPSKITQIHAFVDKKLKTVEESRLLKQFFENRARQKAIKKEKEELVIYDPLDFK